MSLPHLLRTLFQRRRLEAEMSDEMRFHLDMLIEENIRRGLPAKEARLAALREFGGVEQHKERARDERGGRWLADLAQDLRIGLRRLRRERRFAALCVLVLALGVGATTVMFSVADAVLLRPLPVAEPDRVIRLWEGNPSRGIKRFSVSYPNYSDWAARSGCWEILAAFDNRNVNLMVHGEPERLRAGVATANALPLFGWRILKGRGLGPADDQPGQTPVALLSEALWRGRFGADPAIDKLTVVIDGTAHAIVGVVAEGSGLDLGVDVVLPLRPFVSPDRDDKDLEVYGRLKHGTTLAQAHAEMTAIARGLAQEYPDDNGGWGITLEPLFDTIIHPKARGMVQLMCGAAVLLLVIACANLSSLLLVAAMKRTQELSVRAALGGGRGRLIRQLLTESGLLAGVGGVFGVLLAWWGVDAMRAAESLNLPRADLIALDERVLAFALGITLVTGLVAGVVPAFVVSRVDVQHGLKGTGTLASPRKGRLRDLLVVGQLALSIVLLAGAGVLLRAVAELQRVDLGFRPEHVLTARLAPKSSQTKALLESLIERVRALPGVAAVGAVSSAPMAAYNTSNHVFPVGAAAIPSTQAVQADWRIVTADYFHAMAIPVRRGRAFAATDNAAGGRVVIVNEALARALWGDDDPIGRQINPGGGTSYSTVIGVVSDIRNHSPGQPPTPAYYLSAHRSVWGAMTLVVRSSTEADRLVPQLRAELRAIAPTVPLFDVQALSNLVNRQIAPQATVAGLLAVFAVLALVLAAVGLYGVMAHATSQRSREVGIRMALGAGKWDVVRPLLADGSRVVVAGVGVGLAGALLTARTLRQALELPGAEAVADGVTAAAAATLLGVIAMIACYVPVRRALRVDPLIALRTE